ncbi:PRC-barrel domain-containing protein [Pseudoroseicyclus aestuarii]|uniref:PRC-barrel domain protein n=1 Tax=Pseudoroseicyclus aestuarii TaxID=1795041 RepID=A0A318SSS5_9RHOB|nr:PRC-barrel domain-containing protein [Pseudoroseicyclus aestuarii]PYE84753.1 PRC-barrel domain protein [Pseudoroseicyclus aestuarii]
MKILLATAATALALGTTAYAQDAATTNGLGDVEITAEDFFASDLMGMDVYAAQSVAETDGMIDAAQQDWDDIGEINDIVLTPEGEVGAVIVGVGGFLGIGEKRVAVSMDEIQTYEDESGVRYMVVNTTAEALEAAPAFTDPADPMAEDGTMATDTTTGGEGAMATDTAMAGADNGQDAVLTGEDTTMAASDDAVATSEEGADVMAEDTTAVGDTGMAEDTAMADGTEAQTGSDMMVEREGYALTDASELSVDELTGATVYGLDDENVGDIGDLVMSADNSSIDEAVIDVGGFLGIGEKPVAVSFDDLQILTDEDRSDIRVYIGATEDELKNLPRYEPEAAAVDGSMDAGAVTDTEVTE